MNPNKVTAIVPAAGIGSRMGLSIPKQYLDLDGQCILERTLHKLLNHEVIQSVIVALHPQDSWFSQLGVAAHPKIKRVIGGESRAESVIAGLKICNSASWALVHDAARPCVKECDINTLIEVCFNLDKGGAILASRVRDTMKRASANNTEIKETVCREDLWHALTPQMFKRDALLHAYQSALTDKVPLTDEASAMEYVNQPVHLVDSHPTNIKITHPEDAELALFFLQKAYLQKETQ